jgi:hypothetical protein
MPDVRSWYFVKRESTEIRANPETRAHANKPIDTIEGTAERIKRGMLFEYRKPGIWNKGVPVSSAFR